MEAFNFDPKDIMLAIEDEAEDLVSNMEDLPIAVILDNIDTVADEFASVQKYVEDHGVDEDEALELMMGMNTRAALAIIAIVRQLAATLCVAMHDEGDKDDGRTNISGEVLGGV